MKKRIIVVTMSLFAFIAILFIPWSLLWITNADREFLSKLDKVLVRNGDSVLLSETVSDNWIEVCNYALKHQSVALYSSNKLKVSKNSIQFLTGTNGIATDAVWGYIFYYANNMVRYFQVPRTQYTYHRDSYVKCYPRSENPRISLVVDQDLDVKFLRLHNSKLLEKGQ